MSSKRLRRSVVGCNNEHICRHLLLTSEPLKTQWITFVSEGNSGGKSTKKLYLSKSIAT